MYVIVILLLLFMRVSCMRFVGKPTIFTFKVFFFPNRVDKIVNQTAKFVVSITLQYIISFLTIAFYNNGMNTPNRNIT